jgi:hypothetical protein
VSPFTRRLPRGIESSLPLSYGGRARRRCVRACGSRCILSSVTTESCILQFTSMKLNGQSPPRGWGRRSTDSRVGPNWDIRYTQRKFSFAGDEQNDACCGDRPRRRCVPAAEFGADIPIIDHALRGLESQVLASLHPEGERQRPHGQTIAPAELAASLVHAPPTEPAARTLRPHRVRPQPPVRCNFETTSDASMYEPFKSRPYPQGHCISRSNWEPVLSGHDSFGMNAK